MVFRTLLAAKITADNTKNAPKLAAIGNENEAKVSEIKNPPKKLEPNNNRATPKLAPEEIPNTNGPANGFRNKVCINKPLTDNPEPTIIAVIAFGKRNCKMIISQLSLEDAPPNKMEKTS